VAPTGQVLHDLARVLVARGHEVGVIASRRSYDGGGRYPAVEDVDGVHVRRLRAFGFGRRGLGRVADYASFMAGAVFEALVRQPRPDVVLSLTTPPYIALVGRALARWRRTAQVQWIMDLYPDALLAHGLLSEGWLLAALRRLSRWQLAGADLVLALGPFMEQAVGRYAAAARRLTSVPLWGGGESVQPEAAGRLRAEGGWGKGDLVLMYSGNMGLGHRFGEFFEAARQLGPEGPVWAFAGSGPRRAEVESFVSARSGARVQLLDYVPRERLPASLASADVHLVSLRRAWQGLIVPSKLQGVFAVGRPVIFVGPESNEIAYWIKESGGGWVVPEDDVAGLIRAVDQARDVAERVRRGQAALAYAREHFDRQKNCEAIARLIESAAQRAARAGSVESAPVS